jgi:glycosyltransferase involved in cell wall biosynthesis
LELTHPVEKRKILLISYLFPPAGGVSVQRILSFAKYLPGLGYETHVLTAKNPSTPTIDASLLKLVPAEVRVHRTLTPEVPYGLKQKAWKLISPGGKAEKAAVPQTAGKPATGWRAAAARQLRKVFCPDPEVVWAPSAIRRARQLVEREGIQVVLVTAPPFSSFLIGNSLKRRFPHLKLVSDFRDEWLEFYLKAFQFQQGDYIMRRAAAIERDTVELSDLVLSVTPSIVKQLQDRYPEQPADKFANLPNGYDPDVFRTFQPRRHEGGQVVVTHVGTVYGASSPRYYLDGLDRLPDGLRSRFETRFVGRITPEERPQLDGRKSVVKILGFMSQADAFREMERTDYLLVTITDAGSLTGKLFEYLATGKPILAFAPKGGELERLLLESGAGWCADPADRDAIDRMLRRAAEEAGTGGGRDNREAIRRYERPRLTAELSRFIERIGSAS